jgi:cyclopropane fatty-acyl-phospholipid synthase-like methyltransferase
VDFQRFTSIAHRHHRFCNPVSEVATDRVLNGLELARGDRVLDVGCGPAEMLLRLIERRGIQGVGVDTNPFFLEAARYRAESRGVADWLELHQRPFAEFADPGPFAAALCIGASHACGGYRETLRALIPRVRPGGTVVVGEGFWRREPDAGYLEALESTRDELESHERNIELMAEAGLTVLGTEVTSEADWAAYEDLYAVSVEDWVRDNPDDTQAEAMLEHIRSWRRTYLTWGWNTLGFALYVGRVAG